MSTAPLLVDPPSVDGPVAAEVQLGPPPLREAFTQQSTMNIVYYMLLALHSITFEQLLPQFLAYPIQDSSDWRLPFKFSGGLGLQPPEIGKIFSIFGLAGIILQVLQAAISLYSILLTFPFSAGFLVSSCCNSLRQPQMSTHGLLLIPCDILQCALCFAYA
jgi:hypothetical protein